jgi:hypothetical protein
VDVKLKIGQRIKELREAAKFVTGVEISLVYDQTVIFAVAANVN